MPAEYRIGRLHGEYVVSWWADGKRHRHRLGTADLAEAKRLAVAKVREVVKPAADPTIADLWTEYCAEKAAKPVVVTMGHEWKALGPVFGPLRPSEITTAVCRSYAAARRAAGLKDGTIWTHLGHLRTVLKWAADTRRIAHAPPIERPPKPAPKDRYLTRSEAARLIEAADMPHIRLAILLMLSTAARVGAVLDLTWDRVDFDRRQIRLANPDHRTGKGRATVPMNGSLLAALSEAKRGALTDHVIEWAGAPVASIKTGFRAAAKRAGLVEVTPHVLRHTAAVHLAEAGTPMERIAQYLGHRDHKITEMVYARFSPDHMRAEAEVLDFTAYAERRSQVR